MQLQWLNTLPPKFERMKKLVELLAGGPGDDAQMRSLTRILDELKAQAASASITTLSDGFGYMSSLARRAGGHQTKMRGLREMLAGARMNFEGALREASTPVADPDAEDATVSS
jgi:hypothetical protein